MSITAQTIEAQHEKMRALGLDPEVMRAWVLPPGAATTGLQAYDLEPAVQHIYPVITPLRNKIARVPGAGGSSTSWKAVTAIDVNMVSPGVPEGERAQQVETTVVDYSTPYCTIGYEDSVTEEAELAAQGVEDLVAGAAERLITACFQGEESLIIGGNRTLAAGTTPTPTVATATTGGTIAAATYQVRCVALTHQAFVRASMVKGVPTTQVYTPRLSSSGSAVTVNLGAAQVSAAAPITTTGSTSTVSATVTPVRNCVGYAWFIGSDAGDNCKLAAITTINSVLLTALPATITAPTGFASTVSTASAANFGSDRSTNSLVWDGLLSLASTAALGSYYDALATGTPGTGTPLTKDGRNGIVQVNKALKSFWDNWRMTPTAILVNTQEKQNMTAGLLASQAPSIMIGQNVTPNSAAALTLVGGATIGRYMNPYSMEGGLPEIPVMIHPGIPAGTILYVTDALPYAVPGIPALYRMKVQKGMYMREWPEVRRAKEIGVYERPCFQHYAPFTLGVTTNIADGIA